MQKLYPIADIEEGSWTSSTLSKPLYPHINEVNPTTYINTGVKKGDLCSFQIDSGTLPGTGTKSVWISSNGVDEEGGVFSFDILIRLLSEEILVQEWNLQIGTSPTYYQNIITNSITNYNDLQVEIVTNNDTDFQALVYEIYVELPEEGPNKFGIINSVNFSNIETLNSSSLINIGIINEYE